MGGTSRVWAQPPYGTLKSVFGTHNFHSAYEICKGPRHFAGILTDEIGSPWMEVEQGPLVYVQWGTAAEYSNYDSTNRTVVDCSQRAYKHILVDPRMTAGKGSRPVAAFARRHRPVPVAYVAEVDSRQRSLRRSVRSPLDQRAFPVEPRRGWPHEEAGSRK